MAKLKTATPSVLSAIQKLRTLLTREEKFKWVSIVGFAFITSWLEMLTAGVIVIFARILNKPDEGQKYLDWLGVKAYLSPGKIVLYTAIIVGVIYLIKNIVAAFEVFYQNFSIQNMNYNFKNKLLRRYAGTDYGFYLTRNSSLGMQVVGSDTELMFSNGMISLAAIISDSVIFFSLIAVIIFMNPSLALVVFSVGTILGIVITKFLLPQLYYFARRMQEADLCGGQNLLQFFHAFKEIVLFGKRDAFVNAYKFHSRKKTRIQAIQTAINSMPRMVIEVLFVGLFVSTIAFLCLKNESSVQMMGVLGGYLYVGFRLMPGLNRIITHMNTFKSIIPSIELAYIEFHMAAEKENYLNIPEFRFEHAICLTDVSFRYLNTEKDALTHISFSISKGECIGIIGETGSGKSTLVDVILGLLKPYAGTVMVDGKFPVNSYQWHKLIGYVPQNIYLTDDTIGANIAFGEQEIDLAKLNAAIDAAQLRKFIDQLPQQASTVVGERGIRLSGGERQRIAIARALYRNPEVLIFDEATSALDNETEAKLMETIHSVSKNRTVIMIAHRLSTLKDCARIVVMGKCAVNEIREILHVKQ